VWIFMVVTAAAVGATAPLATQGAARPALATAIEAVHSLTGTVVDYYSREPMASLELSLEWAGAQSSRCAFNAMKTTSDAQGRFRFDGVPDCPERSSLLWLWVHPCEGCRRVQPRASGGAALRPTINQTDTGVLLVPDDVAAVDRFASFCGQAGPAASTLASDLVVIYRDRQGRWRSSFPNYDSWLTKGLLPWQAVLCLDNHYDDAGEYGDSGVRGHRTTTKATLVRLRDGRRFTTKAVADPPRAAFTRATKPPAGTGDVYSEDQYGDTDGKIEAWLREIAAKNR
jgi:hypothetical protein